MPARRPASLLLLHSNTAEGGGGIALFYSAAQLRGNTVISNQASYASGIGLAISPAELRGNVIRGNRAAEGVGEGT